MNCWLRPRAQEDLREAAAFYREKAGVALSVSRTIVRVLAIGEIGSSVMAHVPNFRCCRLAESALPRFLAGAAR